jgi:exosortase
MPKVLTTSATVSTRSAAGSDRWLAGLLLAAQAVILWRYGWRTFPSEHYSHFPLVLAAAAFVAWDRYRRKSVRLPLRGEVDDRGRKSSRLPLRNQGARSGTRREFRRDTDDTDVDGRKSSRLPLRSARLPLRIVATGWLLAGGIAVATATLLYSSFLGIISCLFSWAGYLVWSGGFGRLRASLPVGAILLFAIPLPLGLIDPLVLHLQFTASWLASRMLDALVEPHYLQGAVLVTPEAGFELEGACSGIHSLFSSLALITIVGVWRAYPLGRLLFNLLQTFGWVLVGNAGRIASIVVLDSQHLGDWSRGWQHELLGALAFAMIVGLVLSTDQLFELLRQWRLYREKYGEQQEEVIVPSAAISTSDGDATGGDATDWEVHRTGSPRWLDARWLRGSVFLLWGGVLVISLVVLSNRVIGRSGLETAWSEAFAEQPAPRMEWLPVELAGWRLEDFQHIERGEQQLQAAESYVWTYRRGNVQALVSIDRPWTTWHNLDACYTALGWRTRRKHGLRFDRESPSGVEPEMTVEGEARLGGLELSNIAMRRDAEHGQVWFTCIDRRGERLPPPVVQPNHVTWRDIRAVVRQEIARSLGWPLAERKAAQGIVLPGSTIQVYSRQTQPYAESEREAVERLFLESCVQLLGTPYFAIDERPSGTRL